MTSIIYNIITEEENINMIKEITKEKVEFDLRSMDPNKASRMDDFLSHFIGHGGILSRVI
jgi:hypothetical protein